MTYKLTNYGVLRVPDGANIPPDSKNRDWVEYQKWISDGNTPLPKDPDPLPTQDEIDASTAKQYGKLAALKGMTPAQVQAWVDANNFADVALNYGTNLISFETTDAGIGEVYSEVQATFGNYDVVIKDPGSETGPLKRYGQKRLTIDGGDILIAPDTDVATGIASGMFDTVKYARRIFTAKIKMTPWLDLSDTVSVTWGVGGAEFDNFICKVVGVRHDTEAMVTTLDLQEILI